MEEPPAHAIFILATTEKHKIIPTILSRCQIFDFNRIQIEDIARHLDFIAKSENISAETDGLHIIAQKADGALRDALSMFDQIVSFAGNTITYKAVIDNLNILDYDYYFKMTDFILSEKTSDALLLFNEILNNGFDGHNFINGLAEHYRNLLVTQDTATLLLLEVGTNIREKYKEQSAKCTLHFLINGLNTLNAADFKYKVSKNQRLLVELSLIQLCAAQLMKNSQAAEKKNDTLEEVPSESKKIDSPSEKKEIAPIAIANDSDKPKENFNSEHLKQTINIPTTSIFNVPKTTKPNAAASINESIQVEAQKNNPFSQEILGPLWETYAVKMNEIGKVNFSSTLSTYKPILKENYLIEFSLDNKVQEEEFNREKLDLLGFLRKELKNSDIQINTLLNKVENEKKPYTNVEKYKHMMSLNPTIDYLRKELDLEV